MPGRWWKRWWRLRVFISRFRSSSHHLVLEKLSDFWWWTIHFVGGFLVMFEYSCDIIWLVVWNMNFMFHFIWDNPSHWLIVFKMVETTNQLWHWSDLRVYGCSPRVQIRWFDRRTAPRCFDISSLMMCVCIYIITMYIRHTLLHTYIYIIIYIYVMYVYIYICLLTLHRPWTAK